MAVSVVWITAMRALIVILPERDTENGWRLVQDDQQALIVNGVVRRVLDGEPLQRIAHNSIWQSIRRDGIRAVIGDLTSGIESCCPQAL
jgi:hypothetical protein